MAWLDEISRFFSIFCKKPQNQINLKFYLLKIGCQHCKKVFITSNQRCYVVEINVDITSAHLSITTFLQRKTRRCLNVVTRSELRYCNVVTTSELRCCNVVTTSYSDVVTTSEYDVATPFHSNLPTTLWQRKVRRWYNVVTTLLCLLCYEELQ